MLTTKEQLSVHSSKAQTHAGVKVSSILRLSNLQVQLGLADSPLIAPQAGYISVDLPRSDRQVASFGVHSASIVNLSL